MGRKEKIEKLMNISEDEKRLMIRIFDSKN
jgi:hypothetical protein